MWYGISLQERAADAESEKEVLQNEISAERDNNQSLQVYENAVMHACNTAVSYL